MMYLKHVLILVYIMRRMNKSCVKGNLMELEASKMHPILIVNKCAIDVSNNDNGRGIIFP